MATSSTLSPGVIVNIEGKLYRVESSVKVSATKGKPFVKAKLKDITTGDLVEKNFKPTQQIDEVALTERELEFLYLDDEIYLFLDINTLDEIKVPIEIVGKQEDYLKEGVTVKGTLYGDIVATVELPQFLELMVKALEGESEDAPVANVTRMATLETGAKVEVPGFVEAGDIIKVDTKSNEYIQRV